MRCTLRWAGTLRCAACACDPARRAERAAHGGRPPELTRRWRGGAAEGNFQGGHGRETGKRGWVGSREKWLYFSYTQGVNTRLVVTDMEQARTQVLYQHLYCARGQAENEIKDHKLSL